MFLSVFNDLFKLIKQAEDLLIYFDEIHPHIKELMEICTSATFERKVSCDNLRQIERVLIYLHDHLNIGKWDEVPIYKRRAFTCASYIKALIKLGLDSKTGIVREEMTEKTKEKLETVKSVMQIVDIGFLLGLPIQGNINLLTDCASILTKFINSQETDENECSGNSCYAGSSKFPNKKLKIESTSKASIHNDSSYRTNSIEIDIISCPSIETFRKKYFSEQTPLVIQDCMSFWPAMTKWHDINYLLNMAGERTVPIELGSSYSAEDFSQKLMTLREFISKYYNAQDGDEIGYLAQHDLLTQVPQLIEDIKIPDYCCLKRVNSEPDDDAPLEPEINAWLGPKGTVSSLHYDSKDNLLCQIYGSKLIIMFAPSDTQYLYVHDDMPLLANTSQVDPTNPDLQLFPDFTKAVMYTCTLYAGEMLYIPPKWWHHVTALDKSFSVNFWWK